MTPEDLAGLGLNIATVMALNPATVAAKGDVDDLYDSLTKTFHMLDPYTGSLHPRDYNWVHKCQHVQAPIQRFV